MIYYKILSNSVALAKRDVVRRYPSAVRFAAKRAVKQSLKAQDSANVSFTLADFPDGGRLQ